MGAAKTDTVRPPDDQRSSPRRADAPADQRRLAVAVVGAGLSGLACARTLAAHGHRVRVFDKARGVGGRMSTRRAGVWRFDHGAQYFTARDALFRRQVDSWIEEDVVARWDGVVAVLGGGDSTRPEPDRGPSRSGQTERFVGVPDMSAVCRRLAAGRDVVLETHVTSIERRAAGWRLASAENLDLGRYDAAVVSAPAPQTAELIAGSAPEIAARAARVEMAPCWAVMASFAEPLATSFDGAFVHGSPLGWVARNASKPSRPDGEAWVLHATPEWSRRHLDLDREDAARRLLEAFRTASDTTVGAPVHLDAHRWRFALPEPLAEPCLFDAEALLAACGDWCGGPRVEGAFLSGRAAAERLLALHPGPEPRAAAASGR